MILAACRFAGIDPDQTFFIGDRDSDMIAAENAGCRGIRICRGGQAEQSGGRTPHKHCFTALMDAVLSIYGESI